MHRYSAAKRTLTSPGPWAGPSFTLDQCKSASRGARVREALVVCVLNMPSCAAACGGTACDALPNARTSCAKCTLNALCNKEVADFPSSSLLPPLAGRRVALLLTGEPFRSGANVGRGKGSLRVPDRPCNLSSLDAQRAASISQRRQLIEPLEARGAAVEVIFTVPPCTQGGPFGELLRALLAEYLHPRRVVRSASVPAVIVPSKSKTR